MSAVHFASRNLIRGRDVIEGSTTQPNQSEFGHSDPGPTERVPLSYLDLELGHPGERSLTAERTGATDFERRNAVEYAWVF